MRTISKRIYNEMGDGYDEVMLIADDDGSNVSILHVGKFYEDAISTVNTTGMNEKGYRA